MTKDYRGPFDYSQMIKPEDIKTRDKLTIYNELLVKLLVWQGANDTTPESLEEEERIKIELALLYLTMNAEEKVEASLNLARILRGCHEDNGTIVPMGSEPPPQVGDFLE